MSGTTIRPAVSRAHSLRGIALMIGAVGLLVVSDALAKYLVETFPVGQVLALRHVAVVLVVLVYAAVVTSPSSLRAHNIPGQALRGLLFIGGTLFMIIAVKLLPLATVTSITMSSPIFVAALSAPLLKEHVSRARWLAIVGGFAGVLMIVRPGAHGFDYALLVAVATALCNGLRDLSTRHLARTETSISMLFWSNVIVAVAGLMTVGADWLPLGASGIAWFALAGVLNAAAHFLVIEAMRYGEVAVVAPFRYTALRWSMSIGFLVWSDVPDRWVIAGALVIAASGIAMILLEARPTSTPGPTRNPRSDRG
jgi:drug/metabolite transporter (DMT)-like permease